MATYAHRKKQAAEAEKSKAWAFGARRFDGGHGNEPRFILICDDSQGGEMLGVLQTSITHLVYSKRIRGIKVGNSWLIYLPSFEKYGRTKSPGDNRRPENPNPLDIVYLNCNNVRDYYTLSSNHLFYSPVKKSFVESDSRILPLMPKAKR